VSTKNNKAEYFLTQRHQTATKRSNFPAHSDLTDNCESAYDYDFHLTRVMLIPGKTFHTSYILAINKTVTVKPQIQKLSALT